MILGSGLWIVFFVYGGFPGAGSHVHFMTATGIVMMLVFLHLYFAPYRRLRAAVAASDWPTGGKQLAVIRRLVGFNLLLGLVTVAVGAGGRYLIG